MKSTKNIYVFLYFISLLQILRLFYIKFFYKNILNSYSNQQYFNYIPQFTLRAPILDRNNNILAENKDFFSACYSPTINPSEETLKFIKKEYPKIYKKIQENKKTHFFYLKRKINNSDIDSIKNKNLDDIIFIKEYERIYPHKFLSPIIGIVDIDMKGIAGIEYSIDNILKQELTTEKKLFFESSNYDEEQKKEPVFLTIDSILSHKIYRIIKDSLEKYNSEYITAVVMNPENGDILSIVQYPYFDIENKNSSNLNYLKPIAITDSYEFGSIFKAFCMLSALEDGVITPEEIIDCKSTKHTFIKHFPVNTWKAHGEIPFKTVIRESNNIGIAQIAMRLDKKLYDYYKKMRFIKKTNIELPGEISGSMTNPKHWSAQSILSLSYGYEISASLLQLVQAWSLFTNNGKITSPRITFNKEIKISDQIFKNSSIEQSREIIEYTKERIPRQYCKIFENIKIFGKTGTANVLENGEYNPNKNTYVFVGNIEKENYKRIIGVYVRRCKMSDVYASTIAQPIFFDIAKTILIHDKI
jgi:cell division protein FtsI (penicillin-binding protein 3)